MIHRPRPRRSSLPGKVKPQTGRVHKRRSSTQYTKSPPRPDASTSSSCSTDPDREANLQSAISSESSSIKPPAPGVVHIIPGRNMKEVILDNDQPYLNELKTSPVNIGSPSEPSQEAGVNTESVQDIQTTRNARNFETFNGTSLDETSLPVGDTLAGLSETLADPIFFQAATDSVNVLK